MSNISLELQQKLFKQLKSHEGLRLSKYKDSKGYWTIGIGHCIDNRITSDPADQFYLMSDTPIDENTAINLFWKDLDQVLNQLDRYIYWWKFLPEIQKRILIDMTFNLGIGNLLHFHKFLMALYDGDNSLAAAEMKDSDWFRDLDKLNSLRAKTLVHWMENNNEIPISSV
jgi:lysozyme